MRHCQPSRTPSSQIQSQHGNCVCKENDAVCPEPSAPSKSFPSEPPNTPANLLQPVPPTLCTLSTLLLGPLQLQVCWCKAQHGMTTVASLLPIHLLPKLQLTLWFKTKGVIKEPCRDCLLGEEAWALVHLLKNKPKHKQRQMEFLSL